MALTGPSFKFGYLQLHLSDAALFGDVEMACIIYSEFPSGNVISIYGDTTFDDAYYNAKVFQYEDDKPGEILFSTRAIYGQLRDFVIGLGFNTRSFICPPTPFRR